jgi:hypothetical protein
VRAVVEDGCAVLIATEDGSIMVLKAFDDYTPFSCNNLPDRISDANKLALGIISQDEFDALVAQRAREKLLRDSQAEERKALEDRALYERLKARFEGDK